MFRDERPGNDPTPTIYKYDGGIIDFVTHVNASKEALFTEGRLPTRTAPKPRAKRLEIAFQWNTGFNYRRACTAFANGINTIEGGMHEEGFKKALTNA